MGRSIQHRDLLLHLMDLSMHLYLFLLKPDISHHLFFKLFFELLNDLLLVIFISDKGTEAFLNASPGLVCVDDLLLCYFIDILVALNIMVHLGVNMVSCIISVQHLLHLTDLTLNIAHLLDSFAPVTIDTVQLVQDDC